MKTLGQITLNVSLFLYLFYLLPQIFHNFKLQSTKSLSFLMHFILYFAYIADLLYGFGTGMQWQYKTITIIGIICLTIQHFQFYKYRLLENPKEKGFSLKFYSASAFLYLTFLMVIFLLTSESKNSFYFIFAGAVSQIGWLCYTVPQIVKNFLLKTTQGLSRHFVILAIMVAVCDSISAWTLNWPWPSKLGSPVALILKLFLFGQFFIFTKVKSLDRNSNE